MLQAAFERAEWADRRPLAVEEAIEMPFAGRRIVCKLDAVFPGPAGRVEIVDWKTGRMPIDADGLARFDYQLDLYRLAWSKRHGTALELIDAKAYFVAADAVHVPTSRRDEAALESEWARALAALGRGEDRPQTA